MRRTGFFLALVSVLLLALPAVAQEEPGVISQVYVVKPKAGMTQQFEEALKQHRDWLRQQNETWTWRVWQTVAGEDLGQYVIGSSGHRFEDFDAHAELAQANRARWIANVAQYVESISGSLRVYRADISRPPERGAPISLIWVSEIHLHVGTEDTFNYAAKKIDEAIEKTNWPVHYSWSQVIAGGPTPKFILVEPSENWAGFKGPEKRFRVMLEEAYGREEAEALLKLFREITKSETSRISSYRPDLSYVPAGP